MTRHNRRAFTFVDVLVGTVLLSILLGSVLSLSSRNLSNQDELVERSLAQGLCLDLLEQFRASRVDPAAPPAARLSVPVGSSGRLFDTTYLQHITTMQLDLAPKVEVAVADARTGLLSVSVTVEWRRRRLTRSVRLSRYFLPRRA